MSVSSASELTPGKQIFTVLVGDEWFGIPIENVRTIFRTNTLTSVPLAPPAVAGLINVRGEVLTAIQTSLCLGFPHTPNCREILVVSVEHNSEIFGLIVTQAGDILDIVDEAVIPLPAAKPANSRRTALPTYQVDGRYYPVVEIGALVTSLTTNSHAA